MFVFLIFLQPFALYPPDFQMPRRGAANSGSGAGAAAPFTVSGASQSSAAGSFSTFVEACSASGYDLPDTLPDLKQLLVDAQTADQSVKRNRAQLEERRGLGGPPCRPSVGASLAVSHPAVRGQRSTPLCLRTLGRPDRHLHSVGRCRLPPGRRLGQLEYSGSWHRHRPPGWVAGHGAAPAAATDTPTIDSAAAAAAAAVADPAAVGSAELHLCARQSEASHLDNARRPGGGTSACGVSDAGQLQSLDIEKKKIKSAVSDASGNSLWDPCSSAPFSHQYILQHIKGEPWRGMALAAPGWSICVDGLGTVGCAALERDALLDDAVMQVHRNRWEAIPWNSSAESGASSAGQRFP